MTLHGKVAFRGPVPQPMRRCSILLRQLPSKEIVRPGPGGEGAGSIPAAGANTAKDGERFLPPPGINRQWY
jgi:hypothetical protein